MLLYAEKMSKLTQASKDRNVSAHVNNEFRRFLGQHCIPFKVVSSVPGKTVVGFFTTQVFQETEVRNQFNEFIPATTPTTIPVENIKTFDFQNEV